MSELEATADTSTEKTCACCEGEKSCGCITSQEHHCVCCAPATTAP